MLEELNRFVSLANHAPDTFLASHPDPAFVVKPFAVEGETAFNTSIGRAAEGTAIGVALIRKRDGANAFGLMITVGRAANNDIRIPAQDVSKFHAYLQQSGDAWYLTDAGSTFGTFLGETRLRPREDRVRLETGARIRLGSVEMTYYTAEAFLEYLLARG